MGLGISAWAFANGPVDVYQFDSDQQRARYKALIEEFRCPKCLNTNIAGSDAPIAQDLRRTVHRLVVVEGYSDDEVRAYLQERYGDFVLYKPPFNARTWLIWVTPFVLLAIGLAVLFVLQRRARRATVQALDADDRARLKSLLEQD
jgi:cytochrome c-type biogenesis protein CcmH